MKNKTIKRLFTWVVIVLSIISIPFVMQAPWTTTDYLFAGIVLFGAAAGYELTTSNMKNKTARILVGVATLLFVILVWAWAVQ